MYILKNAWRSVVRSKGRNVLIGIIVLVIALSSCVALSIRQAAESARENSLESLEITGQISMNRQAMMQGQQDRESMKEALGNMEGLSLEEMEQYAENEHVKSFYYTASASLNAGGELEAVDTTGMADTESSSGESADGTESGNSNGTESENGNGTNGMSGGMPGAPQEQEKGGMGGRMGVQGDFTVIGYSSDEAMTEFLAGTSSITDGKMFAENDTEMNCVISEELATYNDISTGDTITLVNPNDEEETYTFTVSGIYEKESGSDSVGDMMGGFSAAFDSANQIYTSYENLQSVKTQSEASAEVTTDEITGMETTTALRATENGTYTFENVEEYEAFKEEAEEELGEYYTVSSTDVSAYEQSLQPLENLSKYAGYFLAVILVIGGIILIVLNLFNIRERKYEIGVLAAIGMKKGKIAVQFIVELLCVTFAAIVIGTAAGAAVSVPVANRLLEQQVESTTQSQQEQMMNFGREAGGSGGQPGMSGEPGIQGTENQDNAQNTENRDNAQNTENQDGNGQNPNQQSRYIDQISAATDMTVVLQLAGIGILLTILSGCVAVVSILRYDPLRILSSRE